MVRCIFRRDEFKEDDWGRLMFCLDVDRFSWYFDLLEAFASSGWSPNNKSDLAKLNILQRLLGLSIWNWNYANSLKSTVSCTIVSKQISARKVPKYSGYVRNPSAVGSKHFSGTIPLVELQQEAGPVILRRRSFVDFLCAPEIAPSLLGISPGSSLYFLLNETIQKKKQFPHEFRKFILYETVSSLV